MAKRRGVGPTFFSAAAVVVAAVATVLTWRRLFVGMDLQDEGFYVLVPWRWVLGYGPFSEQRDAFQIPAILEYPFFKVFGLVTGNDPTGLVLYARHLYFVLFVFVAVVVFLVLKRLVRWELALLIAVLNVTFIFWATPQLSYNTMALAFLTLAAALGGRAVMLEGGRWAALASGASLGLAVVAYPSLLFVVPFWAVSLAFAHGRRAVASIAGSGARPADAEGPGTGRQAWRMVSGWVAGGVLVLVPVGLLLLSFGPRALVTSTSSTMEGAKVLRQLGGAAKAIDVVQGFWGLIMSGASLLVAALVIYLVYRRWPMMGRALLVLSPVALWLAAQRPMLWASGYAILFALLVPYFYLFLPERRRTHGAQLLLSVWAPCVLAGAMTAYTSASGFGNGAVGLAAAVFVGGLFLAWALEEVPAAPRRLEAPPAARPAPWVALVTLALVVCVTLVFQFQFQQGDVGYGELTTRLTSGPWAGLKVTPERAAQISSIEADIAAQTRAGDSLIVLYQAPGYYLFWNGPIASNAFWLGAGPNDDLLPATVAYLRRKRTVPTLVLRLMHTTGRTEEELTASTGGLDYPPAVVHPLYFLARKPPQKTTAEVLAGLPGP